MEVVRFYTGMKNITVTNFIHLKVPLNLLDPALFLLSLHLNLGIISICLGGFVDLAHFDTFFGGWGEKLMQC